MSKRDPEVALKQILAHAREAVEITEGKARADLDTDRLLNLALTRRLKLLVRLQTECRKLSRHSIRSSRGCK